MEELFNALAHLSETLPELITFDRNDCEVIFRELDVDQTGLLTYSQFLLATLDSDLTANDELL